MSGVCKTKVHCKVSVEDPGLAGTIELADAQTGTLLSNPQTVKKDKYEQVKFHFDSILPADMSLYEAFNTVGKKAIKHFLLGHSVAFLTYGQAGVGKTFSFFGNSLARSSPGLVPQSLEEANSRLLRDKEHLGKLSVSAMCVYQDKVTDLLNPKRTTRGEHVTLNTATNVELQGVSHAIGVLSECLPRRVVNPSANPKIFGKPSRGHFILVFTLNRQGNPAQSSGDVKPVQKSFLFFVDLAGFERVKKTGVTGTYLEEAKHINHTLFVLTQCLQAERSRKPYRDSVLTSVLHPMFSTCHSEHMNEIHILATISGKPEDIEETISTLTFAQNCMNLRTLSETLHPQAKDEAAYLKSLLEERERQISDKEAKLLIQKAENEELKNQIDTMAAEVKRISDKNAQLRNLVSDQKKALKRREEEQEEAVKAQQQLVDRRIQEEQERLEREKDMQMTEFRIKTATEVSQAFASKVQRMTSEHEMTVSKLMEALLDKQKQEQRLIELVHREQEEVRRLKMEKMGPLESENPRISPSLDATPFPTSQIKDSDASANSMILPLDEVPKELEENKDAVVQTSEAKSEDSGPSADFRPQAVSRSHLRTSSTPHLTNPVRSPSLSEGSENSVRFSEEPESRVLEVVPPAPVDPQKSLISALRFALGRMKDKTPITKLDSKGNPRNRSVWLENSESFLDGREEPVAGKAEVSPLGVVTVAWNTTSRFKRKTSLRFRLCDMHEVIIGQHSPGFLRNQHVREGAALSLSVNYRNNRFLDVIFSDAKTMALWSSGLSLALLTITTLNPAPETWKGNWDVLVRDCGMPEE